MNKQRWLIVGCALIGGGVLLHTQFGIFYWAKPIDATVVDAETQQPLAGVTVMAHWEIANGTFAGGPHIVGQISVEEAVTDSNGRFHLPGWGPRYAGAIDGGFYSGASPEIFLFKSGYEFWIQGNDNPSNRTYDHSFVQRSDWDGKTIGLKKFAEGQQQYAEHLRKLDQAIVDLLTRTKSCTWEQIPTIVKALYEQQRQFEAEGVTTFGGPHLFIVNAREYYANAGCAPSEEWIERFAK
jgi:hypothetical protein